MTSSAGDLSPASRLGFARGMVIQELNWDNDVDDELRLAIEDSIDADMVDSDYGNVVDAVVLWWRSEDGDLVDGLVDSLTDLVGGGAIWLLTPKIGRPNALGSRRHRGGGASGGTGPDDHRGREQGMDCHASDGTQNSPLTDPARHRDARMPP